MLLNGFAVSLPYAQLPKLLDLGLADKVYPSLTYTSLLNSGPSVIGASQFSGMTGANGEGIKVAVVDDGIDQEHPFLDPTGFSYPAGFPKGRAADDAEGHRLARLRQSRDELSDPLDRENSFHGTFVAGIIAGARTRTCRPASAASAARSKAAATRP